MNRGSETQRPQAVPPPISVRRGTVRDLDVILALRVDLRREEQGQSHYSIERLRDLTSRQLQGKDQTFWLAEIHDEVVGILRCVLEPVSEHVARAGTLTTAYVRPRYRRHHIMRTLVDAADAWCSAQGVHTLRLRNGHHNDVANAAWEALGFEAVQVVRQRTRGEGR